MTEVPSVLPMGDRVECPECKKLVHVGTGGHKSLDAPSLEGVMLHDTPQGILYPKGKTQLFLTYVLQAPGAVEIFAWFRPHLSSTHPKSRALRPDPRACVAKPRPGRRTGHHKPNDEICLRMRGTTETA